MTSISSHLPDQELCLAAARRHAARKDVATRITAVSIVLVRGKGNENENGSLTVPARQEEATLWV